MKEQHAPEVHREIALFNTDNEFHRAINEEDIDFNIPGQTQTAVKQSHGTDVQGLIRKIENHPHRQALQSDLQQRQQFNPFSKESKDMIRAAGNIELCELFAVQPKAQCKICLSYWDVGIVYCTCGHFLRNGTEENKQFVKYTLDLLSIPITTSRNDDPTGTVTGRSQGITSTSSRIRSRRNARRFRKNMIELGIDLISKKHCLPCDASRTKRTRLITRIGKALPHLGGTGKILGGILHLSITTKNLQYSKIL